MTEAPSYVVLGRGRWAKIIRGILAGEGRSVIVVEETRRNASETEVDYKRRLSEKMKGSSSRIAWFCTQPGPHVPLMVEAAIGVGLHAIVEKPWLYSTEQTQRLAQLARDRGQLVAVHFEYCLLEKVEEWKSRLSQGAGLRFGARFRVQRAARGELPAIDDLGCHLLAIQQYAVPDALVEEIYCDYGQTDERCVWLQKDGAVIDFINFFGSREPIIQRYIARFEAATEKGSIPFDLEFAAKVTAAVKAMKRVHGLA